jgi:hypothetical protein
MREDNLVQVGAFAGRDDRVERYFVRLGALFPGALEKVAAACFEDAIIDLSKLAAGLDRLPKLIATVAERAKEMGLAVRLVGPAPVAKVLAGFDETRFLSVFASVADARAAA